MKLIIDISEGIKTVIDKNGTNEIVAETLWQAVRNGTPIPDNATVCDIEQISDIEQIRAEIIDKYMTATGELNTVAKGCLEIIDKYKGDKE